jgi:formylmethanofuran dehydrogenase subunit E
MGKQRFPRQPTSRTVPSEEPGSQPVFYGELEECGVCGWEHHKADLVMQRGTLVCPECLDEPAYKEA